MNWARQGRRDKPKGEKGKEARGNRQEDNCSRCTCTLSRALKLFWFLVLLLAFFFLGLDDHDPSSSFPAKMPPRTKDKRQKTKKNKLNGQKGKAPIEKKRRRKKKKKKKVRYD